MQRGFKCLFVVALLFACFFISDRVNALSDDACGIIFSDKVVVTIKFETDGGRKVNDLNYCYDCGSSSFKLPTTSKEGYTFDGWYIDKGLTKKLDGIFIKDAYNSLIEFIPDEIGCDVKKVHTTLYAKWIKNGDTKENKITCDENKESVITINFETDGGKKIDALKICENCGDVRITLPEPKRENYIFLGWYLESEKLTKLPSGLINSSDVYIDMNLEEDDANDSCSTSQHGTLYARWVTQEEFIYLVTDIVDNNFYFISDLFN